MHLTANSIGHQLEAFKDTPACTLTYFYDEVLSHYAWHLGIFGLSALIMIRSWNALTGMPVDRTLLLLAVILYGFTFASITLE
jgi:hypothetical protein